MHRVSKSASHREKMDKPVAMTRRASIINAALALVPALASLDAEEPQDFLTDDLINGRFWRHWGREEKCTYLLGINDCISHLGQMIVDAGVSGELKESFAKCFFAKNIERQEMVNKMDQVYDDALNIILPVIEVFCLCVKQFNGSIATDAELRNELTRLRSKYRNQ